MLPCVSVQAGTTLNVPANPAAAGSVQTAVAAGANGACSGLQFGGSAGPLLTFQVPAGLAPGTEIHVIATIPANFTAPGEPAPHRGADAHNPLSSGLARSYRAHPSLDCEAMHRRLACLALALLVSGCSFSGFGSPPNYGYVVITVGGNGLRSGLAHVLPNLDLRLHAELAVLVARFSGCDCSFHSPRPDGPVTPSTSSDRSIWPKI